MNQPPHEGRTPDSELQREIDRMVDGELPAGASRTLLQTLEEQPAHWRTLALAFVEAQAFSNDLAGLVPPGASFAMKPADAPVAVTQRPVKKNAWSHAALVGAMAASFVLAFAMSSAAYWGLNGMAGAGSSGIAGRSPRGALEVKSPAGRTVTAVLPAVDTTVPNHPSQLVDTQPTSVTVVVDQTGDQIQLPVYNTSTLSDEEMQQWSHATAVRPELVRRLEEEGHVVSLRTHLRQYWLESGELLVVPVEELEVTPVSLDPRYQ